MNLKLFSLVAIALAPTFGGCTHTPLRAFECEKILRLRLGQSPVEVRGLLGAPDHEGEYKVFWQGKRVADYAMWFADWRARPDTLFPDSYDEFYIEFFRDRLIIVRAYRSEGLESYERGLGMFLGDSSYGQRSEPLRYEIGPAFNEIFRCGPDFSLESARADFVARNANLGVR
jgi:hypothetical protein